MLTKLGDLNVHEIHFTDQKTYNNYPLWLKASFYIDTKSEERLKESARLVKLLFYMMDKAVTLRLQGEAKKKAEKARKAVERQKQKEKAEENEEEELRKKREKDRAFNEKLKSLPPAEQRKLEEQKRQKDIAKAKKRMSKMVKF